MGAGSARCRAFCFLGPVWGAVFWGRLAGRQTGLQFKMRSKILNDLFHVCKKGGKGGERRTNGAGILRNVVEKA